ncbi:MAG: hypothetical protein COA68_15515 [Oceanobacter sp.]|jgi:iron complex outermembrane receptor protein|nr:MAG: hypothetical protein COA68_15515 [Oceanobacter sp.]
MKVVSRDFTLRSALLGGIAISALSVPQIIWAPVAHAQTSGEQTATDDSASDGNVIVVTARKREETLTEVPVSISAVNSEQLDQAGITDLTELFATMPGVENNSDGSRIASKPTIRGVGSTENASIRAKVTSFIDGVPLIGSQGIGSFAGLAQVEVLRGPQSAAFGRSTFGGAINYVTADPSDSPEMKIRLGVATDDSYHASVLVSGPIIGDFVKAQATLETQAYGGAKDWKTTSGQQLGEEDSKLASLKLVFGRTEAFRAEVMYMYQKIDDGNPPVQFANISQLVPHPDNPSGTCAINGDPSTSCVILGAVDSDAVPLIFDYDYDDPANPVLNPGTRIERHRVQGVISSEFADGYSAQVIGSFTDEKGETQFDRDTFDLSGMSTIHVASTPELQEYYGELRVSSPSNERFNWLVGASIYDYDYTNTVFANFNAGAVMDFFAEKATNIGGFFNLGFDVTDRLTVSAEGRYQSDKISGVYPANAARGAPNDIELSRTTKSFQPRVAISYEFADRNNAYIQVARGTNPAGFNVNALDPVLNQTAASEGFNLPAFTAYDEEEIWNYEFGIKGASSDSSFRYSAAVYYIDLKGYVQPVTANWTPASGVLLPGTTADDYFSRLFVNTGDLNGFGAEFEGSWRPTQNLEFSGSLAYNGADFSNDSCSPIPVDYGVPAIQTTPFSCANVGGAMPPLVSKYTTSLVASYTVPVSSTFDGFIRADHSWRSKRYTEQINTDYLKAYHTVNLRIGVRSDNLSVEAFATNLFDDDTPSGAVRFFDGRLPGMVFNTSFQRRRPRQLGINLGYNF